MKYANYYQPDRVKNASFTEVDQHHTYNPTVTNRSLREAFRTVPANKIVDSGINFLDFFKMFINDIEISYM